MFELIFLDRETDGIKYTMTNVMLICHITTSEIGFVDADGRYSSCAFPPTEKLLVNRVDP